MEEQQRSFVLSMLGYAAQRGVSAERICSVSGIDLKQLMRGPIPLSRKQFQNLWLNAIHLCDDPLFGLHFGESLQLAALGIVGEIIKSSETVGQAMKIAASLTETVIDLFTMEVHKSHKTFNVRLLTTSKESDQVVVRQLADLLMVFTIHELNGLLLEKIEPNIVTYPYALEHREEYERVLRCKKIEKGNKLSIEFKNSYWDEPILTANHELQKIFISKLNSQQKKRLNASESFKESVRNYLMTNSYLGVLSLEQVAANFNLAPRSLQRKLQNENTNFQELAESVKKSMAIHLLGAGEHQIKEISIMLGYNELSAFSRAFRRWTGKPPQNFRQQVKRSS